MQHQIDGGDILASERLFEQLCGQSARTRVMEGSTNTADIESPVAVAVRGRGPSRVPLLAGAAAAVLLLLAGVIFFFLGRKAEDPISEPTPAVVEVMEPLVVAEPDAGPAEVPQPTGPPLHASVPVGVSPFDAISELSQARAHRLFSDQPGTSGSSHPWAGRALATRARRPRSARTTDRADLALRLFGGGQPAGARTIRARGLVATRSRPSRLAR